MNENIWHAMLKEWYWPVIVGAIVALAFAPSFLKAKCPKCKSRSLTSVDVDLPLMDELRAAGLPQYTSFYKCSRCDARLKRVRTAPYEDASEAQYDEIFRERSMVS